MKINLLCAFATLFYCTLLIGQNPIPNPGFEAWTGTDPDDWFTSNSPGGLNINVTPESPGHTGNYAAKCEITVWTSTPGFPYIPVLESQTNDFGFPVHERHGVLSLYYKFHKAGPDDVFTVFVGVLDDEGSVFGGGFVDVTEAVDTFTLLEIPLSYSAEVTPHRAYISMTINNNTGELPVVGSYFVVDDLAMGDPVISGLGEIGDPGANLQRAYPNPAHSELTIDFSLTQMGYINLGLFDMAGKQVSNIFSGELHDGDYSMSTNITDLPDGIYLCRLTTAMGFLTQKVVVMKL